MNVKVLSGMDGLITLSTYKSATMVMVSVVGMIGIRPTSKRELWADGKEDRGS